MLDSKNLRIGNYLFDENNEIYAISGYSLWQLSVKEHHKSFNEISKEFKRIPISEEWLLKFGFSRHHADYYNDVLLLKDVVNINTGVQYDYFSVKIYPNELGSAQSVKGDLHIKYVHQLQNLYHSLCGKELELKS